MTRQQQNNQMIQSPHHVLLHVYQLCAVNGSPNSTVNFWTTSLLPSIGMGAYHTSLEILGNHYTFAARQGIVQTRRPVTDPTAVFQETINLGLYTGSRADVQQIVQRLSVFYFTNSAYHLVFRNCNHFTETLATALLSTNTVLYPPFINRLAMTSAALLPVDPEITPCQPTKEAAHILQAPESPTTDKRKKKPATPRKGTKNGKKELTEKQKQALALIRTK